MPTRDPQPGDKDRALKHAARAAKNAVAAETKRDNAIWFASKVGASLRELSAATEIPHVTVKRILERTTPAT